MSKQTDRRDHGRVPDERTREASGAGAVPPPARVEAADPFPHSDTAVSQADGAA